MVQLDVVRSATSSLAKSQPIVAAFVGGTSGIGEYAVRALAKTYATAGSGLRVYIVGRNAEAAEVIISDCAGLCPKGRFTFVQAKDLSILKDVDRVCAEIIKHEQDETSGGEKMRLDLLVMSQACSIFEQRKETIEGLDFLMSLMYYSRMRFVMNLLPCLLASALPARVVSVFAAGTEDKLFVDDLSLRAPSHYSYFNARSHITYMTTAFFETLAQEHPGKLALINVFPGLVLTPAFQDPVLPIWFRMVWWLSSPFTRFVAVPHEEMGLRILYLATSRFPARQTNQSQDGTTDFVKPDIAVGTDGTIASGAYSVGQKSDVNPTSKAYKKIDKKEMVTKAWQHTLKAFEDIEAGGRLTG